MAVCQYFSKPKNDKNALYRYNTSKDEINGGAGMSIHHRYEQQEVLGEGGMGTVFRAWDSYSQRLVAIKQLKANLALQSEQIARFTAEAEVLRQLNHPNIVKVQESFVENDQHYIVMEYIEGGDLSDLLQQGVLPVDRVLQISLDLADALTRAHRLKIVHRDLKLANVLMASDGTPRLTDFGIALIDGSPDTDLAGTPEYMPPEAFGGAGVDYKGDIWAFGVMLFTLLTGQTPFKGDGLTQLVMSILNMPTPDIEDLRPEVPTALADLIYRMLEKDPLHRIPSVRLVGAEIEAILQGRATSRPTDAKQPITVSLFAPETPVEWFITDNLPVQTTPFVGREQEQQALRQLLLEPNTRLVSLLAFGGMGKTRLALATGESLKGHFVDGVFFVELAPLTNADQIPFAIAEATRYSFASDQRPLSQQIIDFLGKKNMLLVLDNFEHVLDGVGLVQAILQASAGVKVLVTSREKLNLSGESLFALGGMAVSSELDVMDFASGQLFVQSAKRVRPTFQPEGEDATLVRRICQFVGGMPLAIVLAATWLEHFSLAEIVAEIAQNADFLEGDHHDLPQRQRSIRAVFEYSWSLLNDDERKVFMCLSVFRGGFTREAAQAVTGASLRHLVTMVNKSLLRRNPDDGRYEIHELLRQYAEGELKRDPQAIEHLQDAHSAYFWAWASDHYRLIMSPQQPTALMQFEAELDNFLLAWERAIQQKGRWVTVWAIRTSFIYHQIRKGFNRIIPFYKPLIDILSQQTNNLLLSLTLEVFYVYFLVEMVQHDLANDIQEKTILRLSTIKPDAEFDFVHLLFAFNRRYISNDYPEIGWLDPIKQDTTDPFVAVYSYVFKAVIAIDSDERISLSEHAINTARQSQIPNLIAFACEEGVFRIGEPRIKDIATILDYFHEAIEAYAKIQADASYAYLYMAHVWGFYEMFDNAIEYAKRGLIIAEKSNNPYGIFGAKEIIGFNLTDKGDYDGAIACFKSLLNINASEDKYIYVELAYVTNLAGYETQFQEYIEKADTQSPSTQNFSMLHVILYDREEYSDLLKLYTQSTILKLINRRKTPLSHVLFHLHHYHEAAIVAYYLQKNSHIPYNLRMAQTTLDALNGHLTAQELATAHTTAQTLTPENLYEMVQALDGARPA
jgi:serine/threonine protein kinase/predicted ATPase